MFVALDGGQPRRMTVLVSLSLDASAAIHVPRPDRSRDDRIDRGDPWKRCRFHSDSLPKGNPGP
ncbi:hypothetical protein PAXRUDRAFT_828836 [Paxillus rubicundulus Ve08.2h10]|uniref:Uncharacterized protein n=1 Tax=Paxillus rubicundulus Ve08.2h10 TaxID=930991 RepID=A0A0D0DVK4_9AGAM|nr:hypothetical protein PAXRUDRAFT_828836 [Paxillus rubicundulus Ve08.2h10]